jgi:hypothetical protein
MKKFDKVYKEFLMIYEMNTRPHDLLEGDVVTFTKDWTKNPYIQSLGNSSTIQRIKDMVNTKNNLVLNQISPNPPTSYGGFGANGNTPEGMLFATVSEQYSDGLHKNLVVVPLSILSKVNVGNNVKPISSEQERATTVGTSAAPDANDPKNKHPGYKNLKDKGLNKL